MPADVTVEVSGVLSNELIEAAQMGLAENVLADCTPEVPVRKGALRDSGHMSAPDTVEWPQRYAGYVYYGTSKQEAQNWFEGTKAAKAEEWAADAANDLTGGA